MAIQVETSLCRGLLKRIGAARQWVLRWSSERADTAFSWTTGQLHLQEAKRQDLTVSLHSPQALECLINMQGEVIPRERKAAPRASLGGAAFPVLWRRQYAHAPRRAGSRKWRWGKGRLLRSPMHIALRHEHLLV